MVISVECSTFNMFCKKHQNSFRIELHDGVLCRLENLPYISHHFPSFSRYLPRYHEHFFSDTRILALSL